MRVAQSYSTRQRELREQHMWRVREARQQAQQERQEPNPRSTEPLDLPPRHDEFSGK